MFLGIEIGGTKLQLGIGAGDGSPLAALERFEIDRSRGAEGIRQQIVRAGSALIARHPVNSIGIGFGGPVDSNAGRTIKSHQIEGWDEFPLAGWCRETFSLPAVVANDADTAGLAEARFGAGQGRRVVFYVTVGSGVGGALILDGRIHCGAAGIAAEIGHLRPGLQSDQPDMTVEAAASGWGIAAAAQARLSGQVTHLLGPWLHGTRQLNPEAVRQRLIESEEVEEEFAADLRERCNGRVEHLTSKIVAEAAADGNRLAEEILRHAVQALGWAVAQVITLVAPEVIVIGGGVPLVGEALFFVPLREEVDRYVFPPLKETFRIVPAALGEEVVVHGALALARGRKA
jgi:glucokinase